MKPTVALVLWALAVAMASAQSPSIIQQTRSSMNAVRNDSAAASNAALGLQQRAPSTRTAASSPNPAGAPPTITVKQSPMSARARAAKTHAAAAHKIDSPKTEAKPSAPVATSAAASNPSASAGSDADDQADKKYSANGRRDPFLSPVVNRGGGSGCSTGKKCLEIGTISLRGIVHSETGFIAVVSNGLNKAYFLRENDPVFNGYVVKITGDSIVFQETLQDQLGKTFTREVVKKITTPAV